MAGGVRDHGGGIQSLAGLIWGDVGLRSAIAADLIGVGLRLRWLGTEGLTWADLWDVCANLSQDSAAARYKLGMSGVSLTHLLLQEVVNGERVAMAQRASGKRKVKPKLLDLSKRTSVTTGFRHKPNAMTREEIDRRLGWGH